MNPRAGRVHPHRRRGRRSTRSCSREPTSTPPVRPGAPFDDLRRAVNRGEFGTRVRFRVSGIGETPRRDRARRGLRAVGAHRDAGLPAALSARRMPASSVLRRGCGTVLPTCPRSSVRCRRSRIKGAIEFQTSAATEAKVARAVRPQVGALTDLRRGHRAHRPVAGRPGAGSSDLPRFCRSSDAAGPRLRSPAAGGGGHAARRRDRDRGGRARGRVGSRCVTPHAHRCRAGCRSRPRILRRPAGGAPRARSR